MNVTIFETEKIAGKYSLNLFKLKYRNIVTINISLNVPALTRILTVNYLTSS